MAQIGKTFDRLRTQPFLRDAQQQLNTRLRLLRTRLPGVFAPFYNQYLIIGLSSILLGTMIYRQYDHLPIRYETSERYDRARLAMADTLRSETRQVDPSPVFLPIGDTLFKPYTPIPDREFFGDLTEPLTIERTRVVGPLDQVDVRIVIKEPTAQPIYYYDCSRLTAYDTTLFFLQDTFLTTLDAARLRVAEFNQFGLTGSVIWGPCLGQSTTGYAVCAEFAFVDSLRAVNRAQVLNEELDTLGLRLQLQTYRE
jgi:hypothetical protein